MDICCLLALVFFFCGKTRGCFSATGIGIIYPRDSSYLVGENVTLECVLDQTGLEKAYGSKTTLNSSNLKFKFGSEYMDSEIITEGPLMAKTTIQKGRPGDNGLYYCYLDRADITETLVCPTNIDFGYPPESVKNFKCRGYKWKELNCTWTVPINPAPVVYKLSYSPERMTNIGFECPKYSRASCEWSLSSTPMYIQQIPSLTMRMIGHNGVGNDSIQFFKLDHWSIVVPGEVRNVEITNTTSTQLLLSWNYPQDFSPAVFTPGICNRIKYKSAFEDNFSVVETGVNCTNITLTELKPYTLYKMEIQARSCKANADLEEDLWGQMTSIQEKTNPDIPW